jgi:acyl-CoA thioester hydrolase
MSRVHDFSAPEGAHCLRLQVVSSDIDELGHVNNQVWVRWVNEAALAHSRAVGFGPESCLALGLAWVVRRHDIEYLQPALADQEVEALTWAETLKGVTSLRRTLFQRAGQVLARAETTWVLVELPSAKPRRVPPEMLRAYGMAP